VQPKIPHAGNECQSDQGGLSDLTRNRVSMNITITRRIFRGQSAKGATRKYVQENSCRILNVVSRKLIK
jgi:hypothetical protein